MSEEPVQRSGDSQAKRDQGALTAVTLYAREGCHLCDQAREAILALLDELGRFELREVDIDADDRLHAAFLERIPVVEVSGRIVSELELDIDSVRAALSPSSA